MDSQPHKNKIEIDSRSGFCFGVVNAIKQAEQALKKHGTLYCLGDIVHNGAEVSRLEKSGLISISHTEYFTLSNCIVLLRAHGEPPEIYEYAKKNAITLIDATCPVVLNLQKKIKKAHQTQQSKNGQVVIFGTHGHAEVIGLLGQTNNSALVISSEEDLKTIDFSRPVSLYSQTTKNLTDFNHISDTIKSKTADFESHDTICRQVSNREQQLRVFAKKYDMILFVSGKKSSNGKVLFSYCKEENPQTFFVSDPQEIHNIDINPHHSIGICGATSTPRWLMEAVQKELETKFVF
ncbi:MAG: 4-hydroxy-3-methylbut-2-enyl diphosphate reductase [Bacteroidales bacterium]|jgi:4-hydroxy-3-methylbut-2-enyl diphosphate reductase|nr:4-hydroxy-3-methylbut-2-enyl diphosphate reductase [Bacteroidales bacterium]